MFMYNTVFSSDVHRMVHKHSPSTQLTEETAKYKYKSFRNIGQLTTLHFLCRLRMRKRLEAPVTVGGH